MNTTEQRIAENLGADFCRNKGGIAEILPLNRGGSGYIFKMTPEGGEPVALKIFRPDQFDSKALIEGFVHEGRRLCEIEHPRIVKGHETDLMVFPSVGKELPYYIMEYFPHSSLDQALDQGKIHADLSVVASLLRQTLEALEYLHTLSPPLCHLDVKEANLLVDVSNPEAPALKLSDFGVAKEVSKDLQSTEVRGSLYYWPKSWQSRLQNQIPTNNNRAIIRLPRNDIPVTVDLHMLAVTFNNVLSRLSTGHETAYWYRALSLLVERMDWDRRELTAADEKYNSSTEVQRDLRKLERIPSLPPPLDDKGSIRIPVNSLDGFGDATRSLLDLQWFQRLRRVRQLGVAHLVYPGATHTRFEHLIGAYSQALGYLAALLGNRNSPWFSIYFSEEEIKALVLSVLFHDLGHYPFAHQLEDLGNWEDHERLSYDILSGRICDDYPALQADFDDPKNILDHVKNKWRVDPELMLKMFAYCYRDKLRNRPVPTEVPRAWRAASEIVNGPIDADKLDYIRRDSQHCGVSYGAVSDPTRFLAALTVAIDDEGTHLAVTEKGRVDAEFIAISRYAMFSEVYWHHTVRAFTSMLRRALQIASTWGEKALSIEKLLTWSDDRLLWELREAAKERKDLAVQDLIASLWRRRPYVRLYTVARDRHRDLYNQLVEKRVQLMQGDRWEKDNKLVEEVFGIKNLSPHHLLWDIPDPDKDKLKDVRIADISGTILAKNPGPLGASLSENFSMWVRKVRLFVHPDFRIPSCSPKDRTERERQFAARLAKDLGV